jgi:glutamine amidotransferase
MTILVDYGLGNINAFINVFKRVNMPIRTAKTAEELNGASKIILPGVGAFDHAMEKLNSSGMREKLDEMVLVNKTPVIGICVGMQILGARSEEGVLPGLGWIDGDVKKFDENTIQYQTKLPHMGWNDVKVIKPNRLFEGLEKKALFYFLHSFYFNCNNNDDVIANADYGINFACAVNHQNIFGVQFHPEKSHQYGEQLLLNFARI